MRQLTIAQGKLVQQYIDKVEYLLDYHKIEHKIKKLKTKQNDIKTGQRLDRLNKIDKQTTESLLSAEK